MSVLNRAASSVECHLFTVLTWYFGTMSALSHACGFVASKHGQKNGFTIGCKENAGRLRRPALGYSLLLCEGRCYACSITRF